MEGTARDAVLTQRVGSREGHGRHLIGKMAGFKKRISHKDHDT